MKPRAVRSPPAMPEISTPLAMVGWTMPAVALLPFAELGLPDLLAGFHVERGHVPVDVLAEELAVVDGGGAAQIGARRRHAQRGAVVGHRRAPDLVAGRDVDGERPVAVHHVHHAVVDRRLRQLAHVVHEAQVPDRHQALDVRLVDLLERAAHLQVVAHAERGHVLRVLPVVRSAPPRSGRRRDAHQEHSNAARIFFMMIPPMCVRVWRSAQPVRICELAEREHALRGSAAHSADSIRPASAGQRFCVAACVGRCVGASRRVGLGVLARSAAASCPSGPSARARGASRAPRCASARRAP